MKQVRLVSGFRWPCLDCGFKNFDPAKPGKFEDYAQVGSVLEAALKVLDVSGLAVVSSVPETVTCLGCLSMFTTEERCR